MTFTWFHMVTVTWCYERQMSRASARGMPARKPGWQAESLLYGSGGVATAKKPPVAADKNYVNISAIALAGLNRASAQFQDAATRIAAGGGAGPGMDGVDLSTAAVSLLSARDDFAANIAALKVANEMERHMIDEWA